MHNGSRGDVRFKEWKVNLSGWNRGKVAYDQVIAGERRGVRGILIESEKVRMV